MEDVFQRGHGLTGAVAGRSRGIDLHAVEQVVAHDELGAAARIGAGQRAQRDHVAGGVPHVELAQILGLGAEVAVGLHVHLPLQTEAVEEVDQRAAHERLHRLVQIAQLDLLGHGLGVVHLDSDLGNAEQCSGHDARQLRTFAGLGHEDLRVLGEKINAAARPVFENEGGAAGGSHARESQAAGTRTQFRTGLWTERLRQMGLDSVVAGLRSLAFFPWLQRDEEERAVGGVDAAQHAVAHDRADVLNAGRVHDDLFDFARGLRGALQRRRIRQLQAGIEVALIFIGQKASRELLAEETGAHDEQCPAAERRSRPCGSGACTRSRTRRWPGRRRC